MQSTAPRALLSHAERCRVNYLAVLPPLGPTGVEQPSAAVSWLAGTATAEDDRASGLVWSARFRALGMGSSIDGRGNLHYSTGHHADDWSWVVMWGGLGGAAGTIYVEARQSLWDAGLPQDLSGALIRDLRVSRLDLAADVWADGPTPARLFGYLPGARTRTHRGSWVLTQDGDGGEKLSIGARSSPRYLRIYVKSAGRIRHELELKGATARAVAAALSAGQPPSDAFTAEYGRVVQWP